MGLFTMDVWLTQDTGSRKTRRLLLFLKKLKNTGGKQYNWIFNGGIQKYIHMTFLEAEFGNTSMWRHFRGRKEMVLKWTTKIKNGLQKLADNRKWRSWNPFNRNHVQNIISPASSLVVYNIIPLLIGPPTLAPITSTMYHMDRKPSLVLSPNSKPTQMSYPAERRTI